MKRTPLIALLILLIAPFCTVPAAAQSQIVVGDMNNDGRITVADLALLAETLVGRMPEFKVTVQNGADATLKEHPYVDLGLPSGTLWAEYNLGADKAEGDGYYYAWGETAGYRASQHTFSWASYVLCNGSADALKKYCALDGRTLLEPVDDAATVAWGAGWCMPTKEQMDELLDPRYTVATTDSRTSVSGLLVRSLSNGKEIFLPYQGDYSGSSRRYVGSRLCYWTRTVSAADSRQACEGFYNSDAPSASAQPATSVTDRNKGLPVRPVRR